MSWNQRIGQYDVESLDDGSSNSDRQVSIPQRQLIWKITEVGRLVRRLNELVDSDSSGQSAPPATSPATAPPDAAHSPVHEAIKAAVRIELRSCYRVIAVLEGQSSAPDPKHVLTLRRTQVWLEEVKQRLEVVERCVEATMKVQGGEALNVLYSMSRHGDGFVVDTIAPLLNAACVPYFMQLEQWMTQGVASSGTVAGKKGGFMIEKLRTPRDLPCDDWKEGFAIDAAAQPKVFDAGLARDVLNVGKAVYFLRRYCDDESEWNEALGRLQHVGQLTQIGSKLTATQRLVILKQLVHEAKDVMDEALMRVIKDKENIFGHMENIKRYVLLSKGDFVRVFIDLADEELKSVRDLSELSEYSLQGCVEKALIDTNALDTAMDGEDAAAHRDLLDCVQIVASTSEAASLLTSGGQRDTSTPAPGTDGWSMFGLGYVLARDDTPAAVVLDAASIKQYNDISSILWSMKRAEHVLSMSWHRLEATARGINGLRGVERERGVDPQAIVGNAPTLLRHLHSLRTSVAQFVSTLQLHIVYRVIEPAWTAMIDQMMTATDLDGLLRAHAAGLRTIAKGTFTLRKTSERRTGETKATLKAALSAAMDVFVPIDKLCILVDTCVAEFIEYAARAKQSERLGTWTSEDAMRTAPQPLPDETLEEIKRTAIRIKGVFGRHRDQFYTSLPSSTRDQLCR